MLNLIARSLSQMAENEQAELRLVATTGMSHKEARRLRRRFGVRGLNDSIDMALMGESVDEIESLLEQGVSALELQIRRRAEYENFAAGMRQIAEAGVLAAGAMSGRGVKPRFIGDQDCLNNARSPYVRCAVNPCGPCEGCTHLEEIV